MKKSHSTAKNRSGIAVKLAVSFGLLITLVSVVDWLALRQISRSDDVLDAMVDARWERVDLAREAQSYSNLNGRIVLQTSITDNQQEIKALLAQSVDNSRHISELIDSLRSKSDAPKERDLLTDIQTKRDAYRASSRHALNLHVQEHKPDEARVLMVHEVSPLLVVYHRALDDYVQYQGQQLDEAQAANVRANAKARGQALLLISFATLFALAIVVVITTYTAKQLARRVRAEDELRKAHQDLEAKVVTRTAALLEANHRLQAEAAERRVVESALRESEQRYRMLFESNPLPMWVFDLETLAFLAVNDAAVSHYGYSHDEFLTMTIADIRRPEDLAALYHAQGSSAGEYGNVPPVWQHRKKDGSTIDVEISWHTLEFAGRAAKLVLANDITDRKRLELQRQVVSDITNGAISTADLDDLFKLIHESISKVLYADNCFVALHDRATDLLNFDFWVDKHDPAPPPQAVGVGFGSYVLQSGKSILLTEELTAQMVSAGIVKKSGTFSPSWLGVPLRTPSRIIGVLAVQHYDAKDAYTETDLQFLESVGSQIAMAIERKRSEQALFEANKRALADYESLVERIAALGRTLGTARELKMIFRALRDFAVASAPCDGLVISLYDREKESRRIVYCWTDGEEFDSSNGTEVPVRDGMVGRAIKSGAVVIDNDYRAALADNPTTVAIGSHADRGSDRAALVAPMTVMGRTVGCVEVQSHRARAFENGHATAMRMAAHLAANAIENVVLIERDQEKEEQLRQAQKMESIGTLAGGIAHDFNNLMTAVTGYSDLALRGSLDDSLRGKIEQIKKAGERAATLTRQLLAFSRKQILQPEVLDLNAVVNGLITMLPRLIGEHIVVSLKLSSSLGRIKADPGQIEQVLLNLAVNGRDAMPQGGCLMIETRNVNLSAPITKVGSTIEPGHYVLLSVSDNGSGMDAEIQGQIFEPFFTTKEVGKGTGLGLSTVYGIVKQSGGNVWVYSEPGKGTAFKIYLPRVDAVEEPEIRLPAPAASRGKETILLVEDEEQVRNLSKEILEAYGYSVLTAPDGSAGLSLGTEFEGRIDLVLTDVIMPQMGGKELVDKLKSVRPESKVLYMSGFTDDAIIHHGVLDDGVFFLQKPFSTECLATKVREVLDQ